MILTINTNDETIENVFLNQCWNLRCKGFSQKRKKKKNYCDKTCNIWKKEKKRIGQKCRRFLFDRMKHGKKYTW